MPNLGLVLLCGKQWGIGWLSWLPLRGHGLQMPLDSLIVYCYLANVEVVKPRLLSSTNSNSSCQLPFGVRAISF